MADRSSIPPFVTRHCATILAGGLIDLQATEAAIEKLNQVLGFELPKIGNSIAGQFGTQAYGLAPSQWLLRVAADTEDIVVRQIARALGSHEAVATVVSDAYVGLQLGAVDALHVLAQGCPLDPDALRAGTCARTILARVTAIYIHSK